MTFGSLAGRRKLRLAVPGGWPLILPAFLFLGLFFVFPLVTMVNQSLSGPGNAYKTVLSSPAYRHIFWTTGRTAALVTLMCLLLAYPYAYVMYRSTAKTRTLLLAVVLLPFWSSLLVRSFAWIALLQDTGLINRALQDLGLTSGPVSLIRTQIGVLIGMVHIMLPYMVLPLFATMVRIDERLLLAASSLGANPVRRLLRVFVPLSVPGLVAGCTLVFTLSLGFYITPALLGGPQQMMIGELIADQVEQVGLPTASALGIILLGGTLLLLVLIAIIGRQLTRTSR